MRLYVQSMTKGDYLRVNRVESKSNQSAPPASAMVTVPTTSKPAVVVEKNNRRFRSQKKRLELLNRKDYDIMRIFV